VETSPMSTTSHPWAVTPSVKARARGVLDSRMSRPTRIQEAPEKRAKAAPIR
jgi:hypothetical protein